MLGPRVQVGDHHVHGLELLVLGGDGTHLVGDLVPFHGHVLALDAAGDTKRVSASGVGFLNTKHLPYFSDYKAI